jgi:hypothetical protein
MKAKKLFLSLTVILVLGATSCFPDDACKFCEAVTYDANSGNEIDRQDPTEYCGDELADKEFADPVIIGDERTEWECYD